MNVRESHAVTIPGAGDPPSPCRRLCELAGRICQGCGRSLDEIAGWPAASAAAKRAILRAAAARVGVAQG